MLNLSSLQETSGVEQPAAMNGEKVSKQAYLLVEQLMTAQISLKNDRINVLIPPHSGK